MFFGQRMRERTADCVLLPARGGDHVLNTCAFWPLQQGNQHGEFCFPLDGHGGNARKRSLHWLRKLAFINRVSIALCFGFNRGFDLVFRLNLWRVILACLLGFLGILWLLLWVVFMS
jgi:hypothetical protein